ncbi:MAG: bifunctional glycosyltransferase/class I SAM-dependent methyltransferase [bacterium]|nr:bifunctional glycosyltransferase/class I SAM-dependent methyltransferase [bacterium]
MINNKKVIVVLPAYNAAKTLEKTLFAIPKDWVDDVILVDDLSRDDTVAVAKKMGLKTFVHEKNLGYGGNQKTCYREALKLGADIVVMLHPDFQYDPSFIPEMIKPIAMGECDAVFGSRMYVKRNALLGGMPYWKFFANIFLTLLENLVLKMNLTEYHSGFRAYSKRVLELPLYLNSDGFVFDTEIIVQMKVAGMKIKEIPITTRYFSEASMIGFWRSVQYGLNILSVMFRYLLGQFEIQYCEKSCPNCQKQQSLIFLRGSDDLMGILKNTNYQITESNIGLYGNIYHCVNCDLYFVDRFNIEAALNKYYARQSLDIVYLRDVIGRRKAFRRVLEKIIYLNPDMKNLLDIGCGPGFFLAEAESAGLDVWGLEISNESVKFAKDKLNLPQVFQDEESLEEAAPKPFGAITAFDFIEHALDPKEIFIKVHKKLETGGLFVFTIPIIDSFVAKLLGKRWHALVPSHLNYFTFKSLANIYLPLGYSLVRKRWHWKYLSFSYLLKRLFKKPDWRLPKVLDFVIPVNFFDEAEVYLRKN